MEQVPRYSIGDFLADARAKIERLSPADAFVAQRRGATIVDIRTAADRTAEGAIPHAVVIALSVLPWRMDPDAEATDRRVNDLSHHMILVCNDGYSSSWAAAVLSDIGFTAISDISGGFRAWRAAELPTVGSSGVPPKPV